MSSMSAKGKYNVYFDSLGCCKNQVDSELALGLLLDAGFTITDEPTEAEVIVINTCGFIGDAKEESIERILTLAACKEEKCRVLAVTGCLSQKYRDELWVELPEVDVMLGVSEYELLVPQILSMLERREFFANGNFDFEKALGRRIRLTPPHTAYIKIAEGCDNCCTFCAIPGIRGPLRSRRIEDIVKEAEILLADGVKELILIAQDTNAYGMDIYGKKALPELLEKLAALDFHWIRALYSYTDRIDEELLKVMAAHDNICHYLDIPIQHASGTVLRRMGRGYNAEELDKLFKMIYSYMPDCVIRTTFMVGFPGETDDDFAELMDYVGRTELAWAGCFIYSPEDDTPAGEMEDQVDEDIKARRYNKLVGALGMASREHKEKWRGTTLEVLIEGEAEDLPGYYYGRSRYHAPDVDGLVYVDNRDGKLDASSIGSFRQVNIHTAETYDLMGTLVD